MKRIKYVSRFTRDMGPADIDTLVRQAADSNRTLGITGILVTAGRLFFQVIEGPAPAIDDVFARIVADPRHTDVLVLSTEDAADGRHFPDWSMRRLALDAATSERLEPLREMLATIVEQRVRIARLTNALERAIWRELATTAA